MMRAQRVREGESRVEMQIAKWTAEGAVNSVSLVSCDVGHTSVAGNMKVFRKCTGHTVNQGGTAGGLYALVLDRHNESVLDECFFIYLEQLFGYE